MAPLPHAQARGLWSRLVLNNARFFAAELRKIADQLDKAAPGSPAVALILFHDSHGGIALSDITVKDDAGPLTGTLQLLDAKGNPTAADDVPRWASSDETVVTLSVSDDGLQVQATVVGKTGASLITATSTEASSGNDVVSTGTITVEPSDVAVSGSIDFTPSA